MRNSSTLGLGVLTATVAATAVLAGGLGGAQASSSGGGQVDASVPATSAHSVSPATAGRAGWQGAFTYAVPTGTTTLFFHYPCGTGFVARSGLFDVNPVGQPSVKLVGQGPRYDLGYTEWFNTLTFAGGAPAGTTVTFDAYCTKKPV